MNSPPETPMAVNRDSVTSQSSLVSARNSIMEKLRVERKSERFYRWLHHDLNFFVKVSGSMCALVHLVYQIARASNVADECPNLQTDQRFTDTILRWAAAVFFLYHVVRHNPEFWHAWVYFWMALNFFSTRSADQTKQFSDMSRTATDFIGVLLIFIWLALVARQIRFHFESPKLYQAFAAHASLLDSHGKIILYKHIKPALHAAGAMEIDEDNMNSYLLEIIASRRENQDLEAKAREAKKKKIPEEIFISFEEFVKLYDCCMDEIVEMRKQTDLKAETGPRATSFSQLGFASPQKKDKEGKKSKSAGATSASAAPENTASGDAARDAANTSDVQIQISERANASLARSTESGGNNSPPGVDGASPIGKSSLESPDDPSP